MKRKLIWKWLLSGIHASDIGDPISGTTNDRLCLYDPVGQGRPARLAVAGAARGDAGLGVQDVIGSKFKNKAGNGDGVALVLTKIDPAKGAIKV